MKPLTFILAACFILSIAISSRELIAQTKTQPSWSWEIDLPDKDVWLRSKFRGQDMFDFRLGAGGSIAEFRDVAHNATRLLSPTFKGELTDRVIQWTWWCDSLVERQEKLPEFEWRFNVTQAGTFDNVLHSVAAVENPQPHIVDVYAVADSQWKSEQQKHFFGKVASLNRYELYDRGILKITRYMLAGTVRQNQKPASFKRLYVEAWTPLMRSPDHFNAIAFSVNEKAKPVWWYRAGQNIPRYEFKPAAHTNGYVIAYNAEKPGQKPAVSIVYGKSEFVSDLARPDQIRKSSYDGHFVNLLEWKNGIGVLPAIRASNIPKNALIQQTLFIVSRHQLDKNLVDISNQLVTQIKPPYIHSPDSTKPTIKAIRQSLIEYRKTSDRKSHRTDNLKSLFPLRKN